MMATLTSPIFLLSEAILLCGILTIIGRYRSAKLVYLFKPTTTLLIMAMAGIALIGSEEHRYGAWILIALFFSLLGDIFLMLPSRSDGKDFFVPGLASFLITHLLYILAFGSQHGFSFDALIALPVSLGYAFGLYFFLPRSDGLRREVFIYITAIAIMVWQAGSWWMHADELQNASQLALLGALSFAFSDTILAINRFARPLSSSPVLVLLPYYLAQWLIAVSVWAASGLI